MKIVTVPQMREMDRKSIEEYHVPGIVLMENAALRVVESLEIRYAPLAGKRIVIACGKGNNAGDGLAVARHLAGRFNSDVSVWLAADPSRFSGDAAVNLKMAQSFGISIKLIGSDVSSDFSKDLRQADLVIDALVGTGVSGALTDPTASIVNAINAAERPTIAIDIPSGVNAGTGEVNGPAIRANLTVTFALPKLGLVLYPGLEYTGELVVADIGMPRAVMAAQDVLAEITEAEQVAALLPSRENGRDTNKGRFGHVTLFAGSVGFMGAAALCSLAATRTGAGLTTLAVPSGIWNAAMSTANSVIMTKGLPQTDSQTFSAQALNEALALAARGTAAGIGPGIGGVNDSDTQNLVREFVTQCSVPLVIDADALNILALEPDRGAGRIKARQSGTVLTPHPGELGRLLGMDTSTIQSDRLGAVRRAANYYGCTVLLKGTRTLIATSDRLNINTTGNSGMASGGTGDVLTGVVATLLAQGLSPHDAASAAAYLHGLAGDLAVRHHRSKAGLIAEDICHFLPEAIGECLTGGPREN